MRVSDQPADFDDQGNALTFYVVEKTPGATIVGSGGSVTSVAGKVGDVTLNAADLTDYPEAVQDMVAALITAGARISLNYNDAAGTLSIAVSGLVASDLSDFNEAVDDRVAALLTAGTNITLSYNDAAGTLTVNSTGGGGYTDEQAQDAVAAMLTAGTAISLSYNDVANTLTISVSGLTSANMTDFAEAVQDQIGARVKGGTYLTESYDDAGTGDTTLDLDTTAAAEFIRDTIGTALVAGGNIDITVNDAGDTITIDVETLTSADISDWNEAVDDRVAALLVAGTGISLSYNDASNTLTITATGGGGGSAHTIKEAGAALTARTGLNFLAGFDLTDDAGGDETEVALDLSEYSGAALPIAGGGTGQTAKDEAFDALSPTTTRGDLIVMGSAGDNVRLPVGAAFEVLGSDGTDALWVPAPRTLLVQDYFLIDQISTTKTLLSGGAITGLFPANSLAVGDAIRITAGGTWNNTSGSAAVVYILTTIGGQTINLTLSTLSTATGTNNRRFWIDALVTVDSIGSSGTLAWAVSSDASAANASLWVVANSVLQVGAIIVDTTAAMDFDFLAASNVNSLNQDVELYGLTVELLRP